MLKLYTSVGGQPGELIDEVSMSESNLIAFCYENWTTRAYDEHDFSLPLHRRRPPYEIKRADGSLVPWFPPEEDDDEDDEAGTPVVLDESVKCQRCQSHRVADASAHCSDLGSFSMGSIDQTGYVPYDVGIGGGDDLAITYCLDCGQLQGEWPLPISPIEKGEDN